MDKCIALPKDIIGYCKRINKEAMGCLINGKLAMYWGFSKLAISKAQKAGHTVLFATDQWEVYIEFGKGFVRIKAPNTTVGDKLLPLKKEI